MTFRLSLTFGPKWENVSNVRNFVTGALSTGIVDINDAKKVATASSELLENVVKYSAVGGAIIDIVKDSNMGIISLTIKNVVDDEHIGTFERLFQLIIKGDAKEMYKQMMLKSFNDPDNSRLGLARIRYECQGEISYEISNDIELISNILDTVKMQDNLKLLSVTVKIPVKLFGKE